MTIGTFKIIQCDGPDCNASITESALGMFSTTSEIRAYAIEVGWTYKDFIDSCPACSERKHK